MTTQPQQPTTEAATGPRKLIIDLLPALIAAATAIPPHIA